MVSATGTTGEALQFLGSAELRRLCAGLIGAEQDRLIRARRLVPAQHIRARLAGATEAASECLEIDEETLGLDSLARLDLVGTVTHYFGLAETGTEDFLLVHRRLGDWARIVARHFELVGPAARIAFSTSGSTGTPKAQLHPRAALEAEVEEMMRGNMSLGGRVRRIVTLLPPHPIYGFLWSCLLPSRLDVPVLDLFGSLPSRVRGLAGPGDLVVATPVQWTRIGQDEGPLPPGVSGVTSGAPATAETWRAVRSLGLSDFIEIYGATETGGVGWRREETADFRLFHRLRRAGEAVDCLPTGRRLPVQDRLDWTGDDRFCVLDRRDTVVQVAGVNVSLDLVRATLSGLVGVGEAAVRLDGERLKAFLVPSEETCDISVLEARVRQDLVSALPSEARPDRFSFGPAVPRTSSGKLCDW